MPYVVFTSGNRYKEGFKTLGAAKRYAAGHANRKHTDIEIDKYNARGNLSQHHVATVSHGTKIRKARESNDMGVFGGFGSFKPLVKMPRMRGGFGGFGGGFKL